MFISTTTWTSLICSGLKDVEIDHCFANPSLISSFRIMDREKWLKLSDHLPIEIEVNIKIKK